jgi:lipopolysaccharide/colanic/teichoic acid biosynthesis glycosyltransferase
MYCSEIAIKSAKVKPKLHEQERTVLLQRLHDKYGEGRSWKQKFTYYRKKYCWLFVVSITKTVKRIFDIATALSLLILLSPLLLLIAICIKFTDGGPVLYISNRVGKWGEEFKFPKFRSMCVDADKIKTELKKENESRDGVIFKIKKDPRVTWIGRLIRKTSLDELPQLWNVLKGEMSLVGPRPPLPQEVALYTLQQRRRLDITPGLTCIWQVSGRSDIPFSKQVQLDLKYIESHSLWVDFILLLKTIPAVLFGKGAY